eukprot:Skav215617  [mRNA]  locus=scaffold666:614028:617568:- [translate_table: standard]
MACASEVECHAALMGAAMGGTGPLLLNGIGQVTGLSPEHIGDLNMPRQPVGCSLGVPWVPRWCPSLVPWHPRAPPPSLPWRSTARPGAGPWEQHLGPWTTALTTTEATCEEEEKMREKRGEEKREERRGNEERQG